MTKKKATPAGTKKKVPIRKRKLAKPVRVHFQTNRKPDFEEALDEVATQEQLQELVKDQAEKVGTHPGPGDSPRPPDNLDRVNLELSKAPQALTPVLKIPFSIWASVSEIPEMKLSDAEAQELAEPIVALLEYYFPGKIPEIAWMWLMFLSATEKVIDSRVKIRYEKRKERANSQDSIASRGPASTGSTAGGPQPAPVHNGAEPAADYPQE